MVEHVLYDHVGNPVYEAFPDPVGSLLWNLVLDCRYEIVNFLQIYSANTYLLP